MPLVEQHSLGPFENDRFGQRHRRLVTTAIDRAPQHVGFGGRQRFVHGSRPFAIELRQLLHFQQEAVSQQRQLLNEPAAVGQVAHRDGIRLHTAASSAAFRRCPGRTSRGGAPPRASSRRRFMAT